MTLGKFINEVMDLVEVENGKEVGGPRTEQELVAEGYEPVCTTERPCPEAVARYERITNGWIQIWEVPEPEPSI